MGGVGKENLAVAGCGIGAKAPDCSFFTGGFSCGAGAGGAGAGGAGGGLLLFSGIGAHVEQV